MATTFLNTTVIKAPIEKVYHFLEDCNNHEFLQPDNIYNWSSTKDEASFTIQNMAKLTLIMDKRTPPSEILLVPKDQAPLDVSLQWKLQTIDDDKTEVSLIINANLNMMLKMVASGPLQKLVDHQVLRLAEMF